MRETYKELSAGMADGYGKTFYKYSDANAKRVLDLKQNLYRFSGAKTYQQLAKLNFLLQGDDGNPRTFQDFKKEALKLNAEYNQTYLQTEFQTAQRAGAMASKWAKYESQSGLYPNLQYKTAKDKRVRDDHEAVDDVIKPINDPFWDTWYPPNGWNCRCYVVQTDKTATKGTPKGSPTMGFHNNVGKTGMAFDTEHPYFIIPEDEVKKVREGFENMKLNEPMYELLHKAKKAKLEGSIWADSKDFTANQKAGKLIVEKLETNVKIRPHVNSRYLPGKKNPEFLINNELGDLKEITNYRGVLSGLESASKQGASTVVFNLDAIKGLDTQLLYRRIKGDITENRKKGINKLIFIYKGRVIEVSRSQILKDEFKEVLEKLKATS